MERIRGFVTRFLTVAEVGRVINAKAARSQLVGGVIFGIGHALLEENHLELDTGPLGDGSEDVGTRSLGARGLGEIGTGGSAAAVGNAVHNATGIRVHDTPITPDKLIDHL